MFFPTTKVKQTNSVQTYVYSDINLGFSAQPEEFVYDMDAVVQAFLVLLATQKRRRWWRPEWGVYDLERLLMEPFDIVTADAIAEIIRSTTEVATNGNMRIVVDGVSVMPEYETQTYKVTLRLTVPTLALKNQSVNFNLRRAA